MEGKRSQGKQALLIGVGPSFLSRLASRLSTDSTEKGRGSAPYPISKPTFTDYIVTVMIRLRGLTAVPHLQTVEAG